MVCYILQLAGLPFLVALTIWGSWTLAKLLISDWLRLASSCRRDSFCCSITLFSSSMDFRLDSIVVIWGEERWWQDVKSVSPATAAATSGTYTSAAGVAHRKRLTCVLSLIMSASTWELDSLRSLMSSSSCLISSSCSSPAEEQQH